MTHFMPDRKYDVQEARKKFEVIRALQHKGARAPREKAFDSLLQQFGFASSGSKVVCALPGTEADSAMQVFTEFLDLYAELRNCRKADLQPTASIYYSLAASKAEKIRWNFLRSKYSNHPFLVRMIAVCLVGSDAFHLNDQLEVVFKQALTATPFYILEPHWTDIVTVLKSADICPVRSDENYSGIMKAGNPPRYYWKEIPDIELKGTTNPDGNSNPDYTGKVYNFGPCRNLTCPATCVRKIRQCSRCKQAQYCSADCQKAHWKLHKPQCKETK